MKDAHDDLDEEATHEGLQYLAPNSTAPTSRNIFDTAKSKGKKIKFTVSLIQNAGELWIQIDQIKILSPRKLSH